MNDEQHCRRGYWPIPKADPIPDPIPEVLAAMAGLMREYEDRKAQWGDEYLWGKHENEEVIEVARAILKRFNQE